MEQQAVPVAQEDDWFLRNADPKNPTAFINTNPRYFAEECSSAIMLGRLASLPCKSGEGAGVPDGMKPWVGGDGAPDDWDGGPVLRFDGETEHSDDITLPQWKHLVPRYKLNIIAYTPARPLILIPDATQTREAEGDTVKFVQEWMMSGDHEPNQWHRDFAAAIDARLPTEQVIFEAIKDECGTDRAARMMAAHIIAALNARGGA